MHSALKDLLSRWGEFEDVTRAASLLEWDQETNLPEGGARARSSHLATLAGVAHEKIASKGFRTALRNVEKRSNLSAREHAMLREARREYLRASKVPADLVQEIAKAESMGVQAWRRAYRASRWQEFEPHLKGLVRLKRRVADAIGYKKVPYDALLDLFEPGATVEELDPLFEGLREATVSLVRKVARSKRRPNRRILTQHFDKGRQLEFSRTVVEKMGFDFTRGRMDLSVHPFCSGFDPGDVRLTVRVAERDLRTCLFGLIHEAGHGLYEQGIDTNLVRTPLGHAVSLGIHESQSRLWENAVGRSRPFWKYFLPKLRRLFPEQMKGVGLDEFYFAVNEVTPSFIRVEADELTYNLHIILRYEIEKGLMNGGIQTSSLPELWNEKMRELFGIVPRRDSLGVLQDIHWSGGLFGYFPTYTLGNLYAAQLFDRAQREIPELERKVAGGNLIPLRDWLRRKIHRPGRMYSAAELVRRASGKVHSPKPFVNYVQNKYGELYDL